MTPLCVLHINTEAGWRGGEAQTLMLAEGLRQRGHRAVIAARSGGALAARMKERGFEVWTHPMRAEYDPGAVVGLSRLIKRRKPAIVHYHTSHAITLGTLAGLIAAPSTGVPAVLTRRVSFSLRRNPLARFKYSFRIDHVIAVADGVRWVLVAEGVAPERVTVIHSGIDLSRFESLGEAVRTSLRDDIGVPREAELVGSIGALVPHKGHAVLLAAAEALVKKRPRFRLVIVGEGPLRESLEKTAREAGLSDVVRFAGFRDDVPAVLSALDVFALPSVSGEGSPAVVKEAMACRVPVVATDLDGVREIVEEGREALLVPPKDSARLAEAIGALLEDRDLAGRLRERAWERVKDFSVDRMVERTEEVYARVLSARRRGAAQSGPANSR